MRLKSMLIGVLASASFNAQALSIKTIEADPLLGDGYNSVTQEFIEATTCFAGTLKYGGTPTGDLGVVQNISKDKLATELGMKVGAEINLEVITAKGAVEFYSELTDDDLSMQNNIVYEHEGRAARLKNISLTEEGKRALAQSFDEAQGNAQEAANLFYKKCGDQLVTKIDLGGSLIISVSAKFDNRDIKAEFKARMDVDLIEIIKAHAESSVKFEKFDSDVAISIRAQQKGGNPSKLGNILKTAEPLATCRITKLEPCYNALKQIQSYVTDQDGGFASQFSDMSYDPNSPTGVGFLEYHTTAVNRIPIDDLMTLNDQTIVGIDASEARQAVIKEYVKLVKHNRLATYILDEADDVSEELRSEVEDIKDLIGTNRLRLRSVFNQCRVDALSCSTHWDSYMPEHYNHEKLIKELTFFDYCNHPDIKEYTKPTVEAIKGSLNISNEEVLKDCKKLANTVLKDKTSIKLNYSGEGEKLVDLSPLAALKKLKRVEVQNHEILSLDFVSKLPELEELDVRGNKLHGIDPIYKAQTIRKLNVANNHINDFDVLMEMENLQVLRAYGNNDEEILDIKNDLEIANIILTNDELCEYERRHVLEMGKINSNTYVTWKKSNLVPAYQNPENPDNSEIIGTGICQFSSPSIKLRRSWENSLPGVPSPVANN